VFVGPCIAKKGEAASADILFEIDAVLTFSELRQMFAAREIVPKADTGDAFDAPHGALGSLFPLARGCCRPPTCPKT